MSLRAAAPFSPRMALTLIVVATLAFLGVLWLIGSGLSETRTNDGGAHGGAKGLTGYAAFGAYLEKRGYGVQRVRSLAGLRQPGLLVLTPPANTDGRELARLVNRRRGAGPTLLIMPKWLAGPVPPTQPGTREGWVSFYDTQAPEWRGFYDSVTVSLDPVKADSAKSQHPAAGWFAGPLRGKLPNSQVVLSARGPTLVPLVEADGSGRLLAAYDADGGDYPALRDLSLAPEPRQAVEARASGGHAGMYPVILVFEPDLLNNYGFARIDNARLGEALVAAALDGVHGDAARTVTFDLTLNGFGRSRSLLTLAFEPPFLAATLCLLLAALVAGWRAFSRFGPPRLAGRSLAFGKRALVSNAAGLVQRTRRLHLVTAPYADAARDRLARSLALPARLDAPSAEAAIDRALAARAPAAPSFTETAASLRRARKPHDILRAARALHALERILIK